MGGILEDLAVPPDRQSGFYSQHFDTVMKRLDSLDDDFYELAVACQRRADATKSTQIISVLSPHEAADEEIITRPRLKNLLAEAIDDGMLPEAYFEHKFYREAARPMQCQCSPTLFTLMV